TGLQLSSLRRLRRAVFAVALGAVLLEELRGMGLRRPRGVGGDADRRDRAEDDAAQDSGLAHPFLAFSRSFRTCSGSHSDPYYTAASRPDGSTTAPACECTIFPWSG